MKNGTKDTTAGLSLCGQALRLTYDPVLKADLPLSWLETLERFETFFSYLAANKKNPTEWICSLVDETDFSLRFDTLFARFSGIHVLEEFININRNE